MHKSKGQEFFKNVFLFVTKETIKKQTGSEWNFLQPPKLICSRCRNPLFQKKHALFFNLQVKIKKMTNKNSINYYSSRQDYLKDTSSHISRWILLYFLTKLFIPTWLRKIFKFMAFRLLENALVNQEVESR